MAEPALWNVRLAVDADACGRHPLRAQSDSDSWDESGSVDAARAVGARLKTS